MSFDYPYDRAFLAAKGHFDICYGNPDADPPIVEERLDVQVETAIGKKPSVHCNYLSCVLTHKTELSSEEEASQAAVVAAHKAAAAGS